MCALHCASFPRILNLGLEVSRSSSDNSRLPARFHYQLNVIKRTECDQPTFRRQFANLVTARLFFWQPETNQAPAEKLFYRQLIDKADARFDAHLIRIKRQKEKERK